MWSRKRLDIGWLDLLFGVFRVFFPPNHAVAVRRIEGLWPTPERTLACLSVRSGFDLMLSALDLPRGSEVMISAITVPDMIRIIERHGLVPVPVDLDPRQMAPTLEEWQRVITPTARLMVVAHLFGGRTNMDTVVNLAKRHGLLVVEDSAQAFAGTHYQGCPKADVSMFSFGTIKNSTALGGAAFQVRDPILLARMRAAQEAYPRQRRFSYLKRLTKYTLLKALACRPICTVFVRACQVVGYDYDRWVNHAARGFPGNELFAQIRRQPSAPLLAVLERRLRNYDVCRLEEHAAKGKVLAAILQETICCPGAAVARHTHWVFPVLVEKPTRLIEHLARAGFDATQGQSLCAVPPPANRPSRRATAAESILERIVFPPFYPELSVRESRRLAVAILETAQDLTLPQRSESRRQRL